MFHLFGFGFFLAVALYFLPTIVGWHKHNSGAIFAVNLLFGWTLVGWVVALVWALTSEPVIYMPSVGPPAAFGCSCGAPIRRGQRFCSSCGARIGWPA